MKILITGATGSVGRFLIEELSFTKHTILALTRNAEKYESNDRITYVTGNLNDVNTFIDILKEVDCIFLLLTSECDPNIISAASNAGVKKIVGLSNGTKYLVEEYLKNYSQEWTILYPVEFMKNVLLFWQDSIRHSQRVKSPFPEAPSAQIHERDIADVAAKVILESGHQHKSYYLTGPEILTPHKRVDILSDILQIPIQFVEQTEEEARLEYESWGMSKDLIDYAIYSMKMPEEYMYTVLNTTEKITGKPARTFRQWVEEHRQYFVSDYN